MCNICWNRLKSIVVQVVLYVFIKFERIRHYLLLNFALQRPRNRFVVIFGLATIVVMVMWLMATVPRSHRISSNDVIPLTLHAADIGIVLDPPTSAIAVQVWAARVVATRSFTAKSPVDSNFVEIFVKAGDHVEEGQLLARISEPKLYSAYQAALRKQAMLKFRMSKESPEVLRIQSAQIRAKLDRTRAQAELDIGRELANKGLISRREFNGLEQRAQDTSMQLEGAIREYEYAHAASKLQREDILSELAGISETIKSLARELAHLETYAPFSGLVTWTAPQEYASIRRDADLISIETLDAKAVDLHLIRNSLVDRAFKIGVPVHVTLKNALAHEDLSNRRILSSGDMMEIVPDASYLAHVISIGARGEQSGEVGGATLKPHIVLDPFPTSSEPFFPRPAWEKGSAANVFTTEPIKAFRIPAFCVVSRGTQLYAFVQQKDYGQWVRREIFGSKDGDDAYWIDGGLVVGEALARLK